MTGISCAVLLSIIGVMLESWWLTLLGLVLAAVAYQYIAN